MKRDQKIIVDNLKRCIFFLKPKVRLQNATDLFSLTCVRCIFHFKSQVFFSVLSASNFGETSVTNDMLFDLITSLIEVFCNARGLTLQMRE